jgi:5-methylcytosine-specific restriction endonuclease McrA/predicted nucleic acid-binding Zn ribbon protein
MGIADLPTLAEMQTARVGKLCERCGKPLPQHFKPSRLALTRFCGVACRNAYISGLVRQPRQACPLCGKPCPPGRLTCSAACGYQLRKSKTRKPKTCPVCAREFWPVKNGRTRMWAKYCSRACYHVKMHARFALIPVTCQQCARTFRRTKAAVRRVQHVFCNVACARKFMRGENHPLWRGGHDPNRGPAWRSLAASIRKRDDHTCRRCGRTQAENGQRLDVDHIVPWRLFPGQPEYANAPSNLVSLCKRCHRIKTAKFERAYLVGDCLDMYQYEESISLPPLFEHYPGTGR